MTYAPTGNRLLDVASRPNAERTHHEKFRVGNEVPKASNDCRAASQN
jgi:hypothetical protein